MADWKFHCDVLSLPETATGAEIKAAYRKLALRFHPDRSGGSKEQFQRINISYRYLMRNLGSKPAPRAAELHHRPQPPPPPTRRHSWRPSPLQQKLAAGAALFVLALCMVQPVSINRMPASVADLNTDDLGRPLGKCDLLSFSHGNLGKTHRAVASQWDCDLRCSDWFLTHEELDDTCAWRGAEFRKHAALQNQLEPLPAPSPTRLMPPPIAGGPHAGVRDDGLYDEVSIYAKPEFVLDREPDGVGVIPTEHQVATMGVHYLIVTPVTARAWISDSKILQAAPGLSRLHVSVTPIRHGEASVVITDKIGQPIKRYLYTVP